MRYMIGIVNHEILLPWTDQFHAIWGSVGFVDKPSHALCIFEIIIHRDLHSHECRGNKLRQIKVETNLEIWSIVD